MSSFEREPTSAQVALCESIVPRIISTTENYYSADRPHPFFEGMSQGGQLEEDPSNGTKDLIGLTLTEAQGVRDTFNPERFQLIGIPEDVARNGLMWVVMTDAKQYQRDQKVNPAIARGWHRLDHCFAYWDGTDWHASRLIDPNEQKHGRPFETDWETTELKPAEIEAIKVVAQQTKDVYDIATLFGDDSYLFQRTAQDIGNLKGISRLIEASLEGPLNIGHYQSVIPGSSLARWMLHHQTAYQQLRFMLPVAHKLISGRSFDLDSGGIVAAAYHRSSLPSTPEILERGENILVNTPHPPVPSDWIE